MEGIETYRRYRQVIREGTTIVADDRIKLVALKVAKGGKRFPLRDDWRKSPWLRKVGTRKYWQDGQECSSTVWGWKHSMIPEALRGTRIEIAGNHVIIEIHNQLNRHPKRSRLALFVAILRQLHEGEIIRPGSRSSMYRLAKRFTISEYEIRWDHRPGLVPYRGIRQCSISHKGTYYFRDADESTPMKAYRYPLGEHRNPDYWRFEMILRKVESIRGTARQIIGRLAGRIEAIWRYWQGLYGLLLPVFVETVFMEALRLPGEDLFNFSQPRNQWTKKLM